MVDRDAQTVQLSRPTVLLVTGVGVGLLTLTYVLGVQVGKQSAALRQPANRAVGDEAPESLSLDEQLKQFDNRELEKTVKVDPPKPVEPPAPKEAAPAKEEPKPEKAKGEKKADLWTVQILSTPDEAEAKRVAGKVKNAGFKPTVAKVKHLFKVRLAESGTKAEMDAASAKLKAKGLASFPVKAE